MRRPDRAATTGQTHRETTVCEFHAFRLAVASESRDRSAIVRSPVKKKNKKGKEYKSVDSERGGCETLVTTNVRDYTEEKKDLFEISYSYSSVC